MLNVVACAQDASRHMLTVCYIECKCKKDSPISIEIKENTLRWQSKISSEGKHKYKE